jgi:hypothetical protein
MEPFAAGVKQRLASYTLLTRVIGGLAGGSVPLVNLRPTPSSAALRAEPTRAQENKVGASPVCQHALLRLDELVCVCVRRYCYCIASHYYHHTLSLLIHLLALHERPFFPPLCLHLQTRLHSLASVQPASFNLTQVRLGNAFMHLAGDVTNITRPFLSRCV